MPSMAFKNLKLLVPSSLAGRLLLLMTAVETLTDITIVTILLRSFEHSFLSTVLASNEQSVLPVYLGLFVLAHLYQLILAFDALAAKNTIQVLALILFNTLFFVYAVVQIIEIRSLILGNTLRIVVWVIPAMIGLTEVVYAAVLFPIYREFGWQIYKRIGADRSVKTMFMWYQVFICMLKFDFFFFISFSLQLVLLVLQQSDYERYLTIAALPVTLILLFVGYLGVRKENRTLWWIFASGCVLGLAYFVYKIFRIYELRGQDYVLVFKSLTLFSALCLAALLWTSITAVICYRNFGAGLKYHMSKKSEIPFDRKDEPGRYMLESAKSSRMSMD